MTKEQEDEIIASRWTLWAIPKKPSCATYSPNPILIK